MSACEDEGPSCFMDALSTQNFFGPGGHDNPLKTLNSDKAMAILYFA
jgi:hypothetical protein